MYRIITQAGRKCPYCDKAADLLRSKGLAFETNQLSGTALRAAADAADMTTVPIIYHNDSLIGGFVQLQEYISGKQDF